MYTQTIVLCAFAFLFKSISGQCIGSPFNPGYAAAPAIAAEAALGLGYGAPFAPGAPGCGPFPATPATSGGGFLVTSSSPISPNGITVQTDSMAIEGPLAVSGQLPFLGVVALEGPLPIAGQGVVSYGCGNGNVGIVNEVGPGIAGPGIAGPGLGGPGIAGPAYPNAVAAEYAAGYGYGYNGYPNAMGCGPFF